ncbi:Nup53/35/40-type RNA recognition motif-domain-containing protein [Scheffersomyces amazonensis]|uniref:Nup53/35/40-type RNA recognition motif-domain-containing protein n=1 Tax=Scheffersomyces amazonensis TaxID=1078765 RepID=UPI00315DDC83
MTSLFSISGGTSVPQTVGSTSSGFSLIQSSQQPVQQTPPPIGVQQQQPQQQQQQQAQQQQQQQQQPQPIWFQNQKKRIIPNHLVPKKKASFQIAASKTKKDGNGNGNGNGNGTGNGTGSGSGNGSNREKKSSSLLSSNEYNLLSFAGQQSSQQQRKLLDKVDDTSVDFTKYDETLNETLINNEDFFTNFDEDLPPTRSIHDLNDEFLVSLGNKPVEKIDSFINKDPKTFENVFTRGTNESKKQESSITKESMNPLVNNESAIIVFGYPESLTNQIIQHFKEFGDILEDFESNHKSTYSSLNSRHNQLSKKLVPIFVGKNWIKLTFDNPASALDAIQENGSVFNGVLLGVIPYTKHAIEKLQKRSITSNEDIGGNNALDLSVVKPEKLLNGNSNSNSNGNSNSISNSNGNGIIKESTPSQLTNKFEMKDGSQFFLNNGDQQKEKDAKQEKLGVLGNLSRYIFGFHEL